MKYVICIKYNLFFFSAYCPPSIHLSFDVLKPGNLLADESGNHNNAELANGAVLVNQEGKCDSGVAMMGELLLLMYPLF